MKALPKQEIAAPLIPRTTKGRCGTCAGLLTHDDDLSGDKCQACGRLAGPAPPTPAEVRAEVLAELGKLYEAGDPAEFWKKYVLFADLARLVFTEPKTLQSWFSRGGFKTVIHRHPSRMAGRPHLSP